VTVAFIPRQTAPPAAVQAAFAATLLAPELPCPPGLKAWNGSDPAVRLAVHRNNVVSSLIDALADAFPVTQALVGAEFFRAMASVFVRRHPPRSRVLAHYGEELPGFIERFDPAASVPYLADVARLERARIRAYHAADVPPVQAEAVAAALACGEAVADLRLELHPGVSVLVSPYAVASLWAAHQTDDEGDIALVDPQAPESVLILREGLDVLVLVLAPGMAAFITALQQGAPLAAAALPAQGHAADLATEFDLTAAVSLLMQRGAVTSLHIPEKGLP